MRVNSFLNTESKISSYIVQTRKLARHSFTCHHRGLLTLFSLLACVFYISGENSPNELASCQFRQWGSLLMLEALFISCFVLEGRVKKADSISGAKSCPALQALPSTKHCNISCTAEFSLKIKSAIHLLLSTVTPPIARTRKPNHLSNYYCRYKYCNQGREGMVTTT